MIEDVSDAPSHRPLIEADRIDARISELGRQISDDYGQRQIVFLVTLKGAFVFASDLIRQLRPDLDARVEFARASSYGRGRASAGTVRLSCPDADDIRDRDILIIEDILDTGRTLTALTSRLESLGARSVEIAALLVKDRERPARPEPRYVGFRIPDVFVVGYGLDYAQRYRHLPDVRVLEAVEAR